MTYFKNPKDKIEKQQIIHIVPCDIEYSGHANVEDYFESTIKPHEGFKDILQNTLYGRQLVGKKIQIKDKLIGIVYEQSNDVEISYKLDSTFENYTYWKQEDLPSSNDKFQNLDAYLSIMNDLNAE